MKSKNFLVSLFFVFFLIVPASVFSQSCETAIDGYCYLDAEIMSFQGMNTAPSTSSTGNATVYFDTGLGKLQCSEDGGAFADCVGGGTTITFDTVANLPGSPSTNDLAGVTDGSDESDCTVGGGTDRNICVYDGAAWVIIGDGTAAGSGDAIQVNGSGVDTTANFTDTIYTEWGLTDGGAGGPDVPSVKPDYDQTLAGNPALEVDECIFMKDTSGGGFLCEGSTADTNEQLYRLPDANGADSTEYIIVADDANVSSTEAGYLDGVTSAIQTQIDAKAPTDSPTFTTKITGSFLTASEILITNASKEIISAAVATYPSLTELTYVKGVTSAIQTQINSKEGTLTNSAGLAAALSDETGSGLAVFGTSPTFETSITGNYLTASEILITDASKNIISATVATYPSLAELAYVKGVTSAIQTQIDAKGAHAGQTWTGTHNFGGATSEMPNSTSDLTLANDGEYGLQDTDDQFCLDWGAAGEVPGEACISALKHITMTFDPAGWYDQESTYRVVPIMTVGDDFPEGFTMTEWEVDYVGGDPTTELDADIVCDTTPDYNPAAGATVMDVIDTTAGASSADTGFDSATCANASKMYIRFGADPTDANVVIMVDIWGYAEED